MKKTRFERLTLEQQKQYRRMEAEYRRARRKNNPEMKKREAAYSQKYREGHPLAYLASRQRYVESRKDGRPQIYFVQTESGPIKIGFVRKVVTQRLKELQVGNHEHLVLIGWKLGTVAEERELHHRFQHLWIRGEWFRPAPELLALVKKHPPTST
jgi:hypothetical protein